MPQRHSLELLVLMFALAVAHPARAVIIPSSSMNKWAVKDIVLCANTAWADWQAYQVVRVTGTFTNGSTTLTSYGFWDGKGTAPCASTQQAFRLRFTPITTGTWTFTISNNQGDPGLTVTAPEAGAITVAGPVAVVDNNVPRGFLRRDVPAGSNVGSFLWDSGAHEYLWGQTYYHLVNQEASNNHAWQSAVDSSATWGMKKIRLLISAHNTNGGTIDTQPYKRFSDGSLNRDQLNIPHWQALDRIVKYLNDRNIVAEIIIFRDKGVTELLGTAVQDCRYMRYAIARYAAYPTVTWSLSNEWDSAKNSPTYWTELGKAIRGAPQTTCTGNDFTAPLDPYLTLSGRDRVLTIHPGNVFPGTTQLRFCFAFAGDSWPSTASIQSHKRTNEPTPYVADFRAYQSIACNQYVPGGSTPCTLSSPARPVTNDEYGYISGAGLTQVEHREAIWAIATGGGYGTAGDARGTPPAYQTIVWNAAGEYDDIRRLVSFFTSSIKGIEYWKMIPQNSCQANTRMHTLAEVGRQYVTYSADPGDISVANFVPGQYFRTWFDPRNARATDANANNGADCLNITTNSFRPPPGGPDWVLLLRKTATCP